VDLRDALIGYADWQGYGHGERAAAWLQRLEVNRPEIEAFRDARVPDAAPYVAAAATLLAADGGTTGDMKRPADAVAALARARAAPHLHAFTHLPDGVEGRGVGLLAGVPVVVKDLMHVAGMPLTGGAKVFGRAMSSRDAEIVARLRRAGAVIVGLANLHELAYGVTSDNPHFGRVVNPVAPTRIPGGSSGGSAAAVAAGIVRFAVGTDTGGSIRVPAACCGIVGFKPTYDALPRGGVLDLAYSLDHVGPMTRSVEDSALMFAAMLDLDAMPRWIRKDLFGVTAARLTGYFAEPLDREIAIALDVAMRALARDGARCIDTEVVGAALAPAILINTISPEATTFHADRLRERGEDFGEDVRVRLEMGLFLPSHWYAKAQRMRTELVAGIEAAFGEADVLVCPTMRAPAPPVGASRVEIGGQSLALHTAVTNLTQPFNLSGLPAISVPWSMSREGVPMAMQLVGKRGHDWRLLSIAQRLEAESPWRTQRRAA
jgi:Asp-tRNA(Asn)/Glu-tRNA(Gln) amidotransferase A subunit family amidase